MQEYSTKLIRINAQNQYYYWLQTCAMICCMLWCVVCVCFVTGWSPLFIYLSMLVCLLTLGFHTVMKPRTIQVQANGMIPSCNVFWDFAWCVKMKKNGECDKKIEEVRAGLWATSAHHYQQGQQRLVMIVSPLDFIQHILFSSKPTLLVLSANVSISW